MTLIAQISDLHLRPPGLPALRVVETNMLAERAVEAINRLDPLPDFVIVTGDLVDLDEPEAYALGREILDGLAMPYGVIAGNHDSSALLKQCFCDRTWARQMDGDSLQFAVDLGDVRLIGLNSAVAGAGHGHLDGAELDWLERTLARDPAIPTIVAMHHPPILTGVSHMDRINLRNGAELGAILSRYDTIERVICGHDHRMIVAPFAGTTVTVAPGTAHQVLLDLNPDARAGFVFEPPAFMLHTYRPETGLVSHMAYVERFPGPFPFV